MAGKHPSHQTRFSFDASTWDEMCELCGATDIVPGGWGKLADPCPAVDPATGLPRSQDRPYACRRPSANQKTGDQE